MAAVYEQAQTVTNPRCIVEGSDTVPSVRFYTGQQSDSRREERHRLARTPLKGLDKPEGEGCVSKNSSPSFSEDTYEEPEPIHLKWQEDGGLIQTGRRIILDPPDSDCVYTEPQAVLPRSHVNQGSRQVSAATLCAGEEEQTHEGNQRRPGETHGSHLSSGDTEDEPTLPDRILRHLTSRYKLFCVIFTFCVALPVISLTSGLVIGMRIGTQQHWGQKIDSAVLFATSSSLPSSTAQLHTGTPGVTREHTATVLKSTQGKGTTGSVDVTRSLNIWTKDTETAQIIRGPETSHSENCPKEYTQFKGICYKAFNTTAVYLGSIYLCTRKAGGTLAMPCDRETNDFLIALKNSVDPRARFRFGLHDRARRDDWRWMDDTRLGGFSDWAPGEPNDFGAHEDCAEYFEALRGNKWNDAPCDLQTKFICEAATVPGGFGKHFRRCP